MDNKLIQKLMVVVITAVISILATLSMASSQAISRVEVQAMIQETEGREDAKILDLKVRQDSMASKVEQILAEQIRTSTKLDLLVKR